MRPELWRRAEESFHAALEQSPEGGGRSSTAHAGRIPSCGGKWTFLSRRKERPATSLFAVNWLKGLGSAVRG